MFIFFSASGVGVGIVCVYELEVEQEIESEPNRANVQDQELRQNKKRPLIRRYVLCWVWLLSFVKLEHYLRIAIVEQVAKFPT